jgi:hypothetical protein
VDESRRSWERYGALGGIVFVILVIVSIAISGSTPKSSDSATKILKYFHDNTDGIKVGAFLGGAVAAIPILWWAGSLWARLRRAEGGQARLGLIALLGLVLAGAGQVVAQGILAAVALDLKDVGATEAKFFFLLYQAIGAASSTGLAVLVLATSMVVLRTKVFPVWLGWVGVVDGILFVVSAYAIATTSDGIAAFGFVSFIVWAIWIVILSVLMFRTPEPAPVVAG